MSIYKRKYVVHALAVAIIVFICSMNISKLNYIAVLEDEFGYWGTAASIAGYDWSELMRVTSYYAPGYSLLLLPIILFFPHTLWYKAAIWLNIILIVLTYFIGCSIGKKLFPEEDVRLIYVASLLTAIYPGSITYMEVAWSETIQYFLIWVLTYLIVSLETKFSYIKVIATLSVSIYLYSVHNRNIGIWACLLVCMLLLFAKNKKKIWIYFLPLLVIAIGYLGFNWAKSYEVSRLYGSSTAAESNNFEITGGLFTLYLERLLGSLDAYVMSAYGKFFYVLLGTCFTFPIAIWQTVKELLQNIRRKDLFNKYMISKLWCMMILCIMLLLTALQMMYSEGRKDILVYSRYFEHTIGPILLLGIMYLCQLCQKLSRQLALLSAIIFLPGIVIVQNKIAGAQNYFNSICTPVIGAYIDNTDSIKTAFAWILFAANLTIMTLIIASFIKKRRIKLLLIITMIFTIFSAERVKASTYMNKCRASFEAGTEPVRDAIKERRMEELYYIENEACDPYCVRPRYLQYLLPNHKFHIIGRESSIRLPEDSIVLVHSEDAETQDYLSANVPSLRLETTNMYVLYEIQSQE